MAHIPSQGMGRACFHVAQHTTGNHAQIRSLRRIAMDSEKDLSDPKGRGSRGAPYLSTPIMAEVSRHDLDLQERPLTNKSTLEGSISGS